MRRPTRLTSRLIRPLQLTRLEERAVPATIVWQGGGANLWSTDANWVGGKAPGLADVAQFNSGSPGVNVDTPQTVAGVEFNVGWNATATLTANLTTTTGPSLWNSGTVSGPGTWNIGGTVTLAGATPTLSGATLNITGTVLHNTNNNLNHANAQIVVAVGGAYEFQADANWQYVAGVALVSNIQGEVRKTGGLGNTSIGGAISLQGGSISSTSGTLFLSSAGGAHTGGSFHAGTGAAVDVTGNQTATWKGTFTGSGAGAIVMQNGGVTIDPAGATFNFPGTSPFQLNGGTLIGGKLDNTGTILLNGGTPNLNATVLNNTGTIVHKTGNNWNMGNGAVLNNEAAGVYDFLADATVAHTFGAPHTINNKGLIRKTAGAGNSQVQGIVNSAATGQWEAQTGTLVMAPSNGGTHAGGTFKASKDAAVNLTGGFSATWEGSYTGSGAGSIFISSGNVNVGPGGATFNFPALTPLLLNGGSLVGGTLNNTGFITLAGGVPNLNATVFNNFGTITHNTANNFHTGNGAVFNNEATGVYDFQSDAGISYQFGGVPTVNNKGLIRKTGGLGTSTINGTVNTLVGSTWEAKSGTLNMASGGGSHTGSTFKADAGASVNVTGGATATWAGIYTGSGLGYIGMGNGTIVVASSGVTFNFPTATPFHFSGGQAVGESAGSTLTNSGFILVDSGTFNASTNLTITNTGNFTHTTNTNFHYGNGAIFNNEPTGSYDFKADATILWAFGSPPVFNNKGLVRKSVGAGSSYLTGLVNNQGGTLDAQTGTLGFSTTGGLHVDGTFNAATGATVDLLGGNPSTWKGTFTGSGGGVVGIFNSQLNVDATGATFNFPTPGLLQWNGGNIAGNTFTNAGSLTLNGNVPNLVAGTIQNNGTFRHNTGNNFHYGNGVVFNNAGTYELNSDAGVLWAYGAVPVFNNTGQVVKKAGAGNSQLTGVINSPTGSVFETQSGGIALNHNGGAGLFENSNFVVATGTTIFVTSGNTVNWKGVFTSTGGGSVVLNSGTIVADPAGVTFNFAGGGFQWNGGNLSSGNYLNTGTFNLNGAVVNLNNSGTVFDNAGTVRHLTANNLHLNNGATFNNKSAGVYEFYADSSLFWASGTAPTVTNQGLFVKKAGAGTSSVQGTVNLLGGTMEAESGTITLFTNGGTHTGGVFKASTGAAVNITGGLSAFWSGTYTGSGAGTVFWNSGAINVDPAGATFNFPTPGLLQWNGGIVQGGELTVAGFMDLNGGVPNINNSAAKLTLTGTIRHITPNNLHLNNGSTIDIAATGVYDMQSDGGMFWASGTQPTVNNAGILRKTGGASSSALGGLFTNTGTVEAKSGTINAQNTVTNYSAGTLTGGTWFIAAGLTLASHGGITTNNANVIYSGGTGNFTNFTGVSTNDGSLTVQDTGVFNPTNILTNNGTTLIQAGSTLGGAKDFFNAAGTTTVHGMLDPMGNVEITGGVVTGTGTIVSNTLNSAGTLLASLTGLTVAGNYSLTATGLTSVPSTTQLKVTGTSSLAGGTSTVAGTLTLTGVATQTGGVTDIVTNGFVAAPAGFSLAGGVLKGNGAVSGNLTNSAGSVEPGASPGQLTVSGNYVQSGTGKLKLELNGTTAITQYDRLNVAGTVSLGGTVETTLGFPTVSGDNFVVLTNDAGDKITGTFNGVADGGKLVLGGATFQVNYGGGDGNDVVLTRLATGITSVTIANGSAQRSIIRDITVAFGGVVNFPMNKSDAVVLTRTGPGMPTGPVTVAVDTATLSTPDQTIAKLTFTGPLTQFNSLIDGNYQLQILGAMLTDQGGQLVDADNNGTAGGTNSSVLHRLYGDADGNKIVDSADFLGFRLAFLNPSLAFDLDGGGVDAADFLAFRINFLKTLP